MRQLMKRNSIIAVMLSLLTLAMAGLASHCSVKSKGLLFKAPTQTSLASDQSEIVPYKVARKLRLFKKGNPLFVVISVEPAHFVREEMTQLARQLNRDFSEEPRLLVEIMDDERIAEHVPPAGEYYEWYMSAKRGEYHLDREKGLEYVQFSTKRGRPWNELTLNLGETVQRKIRRKRGRRH